nr:CHAD domain-containing protein [Akkermansiaceae bacterium]
MEYAWRSLLEKFESMLIEEPKAWEGLDAGGARRMRVATRRIRSVLGTCKPVLPAGEVKAFNGELKWVGRALGQMRDPEMLEDKLDRDLSELPVENRSCFGGYQKYLAHCREVARKDLVACLTLGKFWKGVLRKGRAITDGSPDEELHALRLEGKRLRYRIEGFRPVYGNQLGHVIDEL